MVVGTSDSAVEKARRRWAVFPCRPGDKRPAVDQWERRACSDPDTVARFWPSPQHNIGVACGPSALVVIDLDTSAHGGVLPEEWHIPGVNEGADVLAVLAERHGQQWPHTYTVRTPSGGTHLYFRAVEGREVRNSAGKVGPMIDVRASGGYVVGAGSITETGSYEVVLDLDSLPLPGWLADLVDPPRRDPVRRPITVVPTLNGAPGGYGTKALAGELDRVLVARSGTRNDTLNTAAFNLGQLVGGGVLARETVEAGLRDAAAAIGLYADEPTKSEKTIQAGIDDGMRCPRSGAA